MVVYCGQVLHLWCQRQRNYIGGSTSLWGICQPFLRRIHHGTISLQNCWSGDWPWWHWIVWWAAILCKVVTNLCGWGNWPSESYDIWLVWHNGTGALDRGGGDNSPAVWFGWWQWIHVSDECNRWHQLHAGHSTDGQLCDNHLSACVAIDNWQLAIGHGMWLLKPDQRNINYVMARIIGNWP